jgi:hypothetical protein
MINNAYCGVAWNIEFDTAFAAEVDRMPASVADALRSHALLLQQSGPQLGRPWCDTLKASAHANMKELRFNADKGVWRVEFAFDPSRNAILLVAGDKKGANQAKFYQDLIRTADARFAAHLTTLKLSRKGPRK